MLIKFNIPVEGKPDRYDLTAYLFSSRGDLLGSAPVKDEAAAIEAPDKIDPAVRLFIGPNGLKDITPKKLDRIGAYEPAVQFDAASPEQKVAAVPQDVATRFLIRSCRVRGRVMNELPGFNFPVCHARVHIYHVTPLRDRVQSLGDFQILDVRAALLGAMRLGPAHIPFDPGDPPKGLLPVPKTPALPVPLPSPPPPPEVQMMDRLHEASAVRDYLSENAVILTPFLCPLMIYDRLDLTEIGVVMTNEQGRFDIPVFYTLGDNVNLYFEIEYVVDGVWTNIYSPEIVCATRWNYRCGTEVSIRLHDRRVHYCGEPPRLHGPLVGVGTIGQSVNVRNIPQSGDNAGRVPDGTIFRPFAGSLEPWVIWGDALHGGITRYRWTYKRLTDGDGTPLREPYATHVVLEPVDRSYSVSVGDSLVLRHYPLGPDSTSSFVIPPDEAPEGGHWADANARRERASAFFKFDSTEPDRAGLYEFRLRLLNDAGEDLTENFPEFQVLGPDADLSFDAIETRFEPAPPEFVDPLTHEFKLLLWIDNNPVDSALDQVSIRHSSAGDCGFIQYEKGDEVDITFRAYHPYNQADWSFALTKGSHLAGTFSGQTGYSGGPFIAGASGRYHGILAVADLVGDCPNGRAAFSMRLDVLPRATDGWNTPSIATSEPPAVAFALSPD